ncbi:hypothetical protein [Ornithinimicrobium panacihumi]|uniref:hypothetical protein n=1 Tax=Ornithinimicrobium panacihumi TaxID=2008449 RepID=UPI003F8AE2D4
MTRTDPDLRRPGTARATGGFNLGGRVRRTVAAAAVRSGVTVVGVEEMGALKEISALFADVWGRTPEGVPMHSESLRSMVHAGGLVNAALDRADGSLLGAAVLGRDVPGGCYSYLAAVRPGASDRGIGLTLKQHQRSWALDAGIEVMTWTYDPLVARNGRFNTVKLGATISEFEPAFYGRMDDELNGTDVGDRMVVRWHLRSPRALAAGEGVAPDPSPPDLTQVATQDAAVHDGPDGAPAYLDTGTDRWIRVPTDIVELRRTDPGQAQEWRAATSTWLGRSFAEGWTADAVSRTGWYHLAPPHTPQET